MERGAVGAPPPDPGQAPARVLHRDPPPICRIRGDIGFLVFNDLSGNRGFNPVYAFLIFLLFFVPIQNRGACVPLRFWSECCVVC